MADSVLIIGSGGREHALAWKLSQSSTIKQIHVAPGNAGTDNKGKICNQSIKVNNHAEIVQFVNNNCIKLVVVGPEDPLANGLADFLKKEGIKCFGPCEKGAQIEASKAFAKSFMDRHKIPTARWKSFQNAEEAKAHILNAKYDALVIKASGLAAGKGVIVGKNKDDAVNAVDILKQEKSLSAASDIIVVEELLSGEEVSVLCFSDGTNISIMPPAQDHKRLLENDEGPNTGGMGAYCPCPIVSSQEMDYIKKEVLQKAIDGMRTENVPYVGVLYAGLMLTKDGPKVLEFNCRFGDPETQVILPLLKTSLYDVMLACVDGNLNKMPVEWHTDKSAVGVVLVSGGYPGSYPKGKIIKGIEAVADKHIVFHAGTGKDSGKLVTSGGRVLAVVALEDSLQKAADEARKNAGLIEFDGAFFRKDIAKKGLQKVSSGGLTYKSSGVDIDSAEDLVAKIKDLTKQTKRPENVGGIGGFAGIFELIKYRDPFLVSKIGTIGERLKVAQDCDRCETAGNDLVANSVNEIVCCGAEPLFFLDTFTCGKLHINIASDVISGIAKACKEAGCSLIGGETAEMPGMYADADFDLTGFARGAVEKPQLLPKSEAITTGDVAIGIQSTSINAGAFKLIKKILSQLNLSYSATAPFNTNQSLKDALLSPYNIYVKPILSLVSKGLLKAAAYINNEGLLESIQRVVPDGLQLILNVSEWTVPPVFSWAAKTAQLSTQDILRNFNLGIDLVLIVSKDSVAEVKNHLQSHGLTVSTVGAIEKSKSTKRLGIKNLSFGTPTATTAEKLELHEKNKDFHEHINVLMAKTARPGFEKHCRSSCDFFDLKASGYQNPYLLSGTDGVGTKLKIAQALNKHDTIGIDLVAMCVNDILTHGAEPLFFLECFDCGTINQKTALEVTAGVVEGCKQANCALIGADINELPDIYTNPSDCIQSSDTYDVVGYAEGALQKENLLPRLHDIQRGDVVIGLASSGAHSNGYSLIRKLVQVKNLRYQDPFPLDQTKTLGEVLLTPTKIYVKSMLPLAKRGLIKAAAHITGGGLTCNIPRVLPEGLKVVLDGKTWTVPQVFQWISVEGQVSETEMLKTFNCGLGMVLIISKHNAQQVLADLKTQGEIASAVGSVEECAGGEEQVLVKNFSMPVSTITKRKKKVGVLISGSGTNLQALIDYTQDPTNCSSAEIVLVLSNVPDVEGLKRAQRAGIPTAVLSHKGYKKRVEFDMAVHSILNKSEVEIVCLAGFMRILSKEFVELWQGKLLNVHPALLPSFKGVDAHKQALEMGVRITGCTVHFVEAEVDAGAIIEQAAVRVDPNDDIKTLQEKVKVQEHKIFPLALELLASGRISRGADGKLAWNF